MWLEECVGCPRLREFVKIHREDGGSWGTFRRGEVAGGRLMASEAAGVNQARLPSSHN